ncbi:MAG: hypothetical protein ACREJQ_04270 [bacterium]
MEAPPGHYALMGFGIPAGAGSSMANLTMPQDTEGGLYPRLPVAAINLQTLVPLPPLFLPYYVLDGDQPVPRPIDTTFLAPNTGRWPANGALDAWFRAFTSVALPNSVAWKAVGAGAVERHPDLGGVVNEPLAVFNSFAVDEPHNLVTMTWQSTTQRTVGETTNAPVDTPLDELFTSVFKIRKVTSRPVNSIKIELLDLQVAQGGQLAVRGGVGIIGGPGARPMHYGPHINEKDFESAAEGTPFTRVYELPLYLTGGTPPRWRLMSATSLPEPITIFTGKFDMDVAAVALQLNLDSRVGYGYTLYLEDTSKMPLEGLSEPSSKVAKRDEDFLRRTMSHQSLFDVEEKLPKSGILNIKLRYTIIFND